MLETVYAAQVEDERVFRLLLLLDFVFSPLISPVSGDIILSFFEDQFHFY